MKNRQIISLNYQWVSGILLVALVAMFFLWRPWEGRFAENARTITVTGSAKLTATPDEFTFQPSYDFKNSDRNTALADLTKKSDELITKLKALGVTDNKIKTNSSNYEYPMYGKDSSSLTYTLRLTITITDQKLAQKVQDYLLTTEPSGSVTPQATFSDSKQKKLEDQARETAAKEARAKAEQSARNLGFGVGPVKSVTDSAFGPITALGGVVADSTEKSPHLSLQPGENDLNYSVVVVYYMQ